MCVRHEKQDEKKREKERGKEGGGRGGVSVSGAWEACIPKRTHVRGTSGVHTNLGVPGGRYVQTALVFAADVT